MSVLEKQIITEIKAMRKAVPDSEWKAKNRELLYNQISSTVNAEKGGIKYFINSNLFIQYLRTIPQSTMVAVFIFVFLAGGSVISLRASENAVPGDSFYIAKIMSEKTQQALTFDEKNKALLGLEFAGKRAQEINQVLAQSEISEKSEKQVEKLVDNFKKEIKTAKTRIEKINQNKIAETQKLAENNLPAAEEEPKENEAVENEPADGVFSANAEKDENGIQVYDSAALAPSKPLANPAADSAAEEDTSSTTEEIIAVSASADDPQEILKKAGACLNSDDIDATLSLIGEAGEIIEKVGAEQAVGNNEEGSEAADADADAEDNVEEGASSTENVQGE